jgi:hypothetical protein
MSDMAGEYQLPPLKCNPQPSPGTTYPPGSACNPHFTNLFDRSLKKLNPSDHPETAHWHPLPGTLETPLAPSRASPKPRFRSLTP